MAATPKNFTNAWDDDFTAFYFSPNFEVGLDGEPENNRLAMLLNPFGDRVPIVELRDLQQGWHIPKPDTGGKAGHVGQTA